MTGGRYPRAQKATELNTDVAGTQVTRGWIVAQEEKKRDGNAGEGRWNCGPWGNALVLGRPATQKTWLNRGVGQRGRKSGEKEKKKTAPPKKKGGSVAADSS